MDGTEEGVWRGPRVAVCCFVVALAAMALLGLLPGSLSPWMAVLLTAGLLFGPWGSLGASVAATVLLAFRDADPLMLPVHLALLFLMSYLPYRLWYSTFTRVRPKTVIFGTAANMAKVLFVLAVSSLAYAAVDVSVFVVGEGASQAAMAFLDTFLLALTGSVILTLSGVFVTGFLRIPHWTPVPRLGNTVLERMDRRAYDALLALGVAAALLSVWAGGLAWLTTGASIALIAASCMRPLMTVRDWEVNADDLSIGVNTFQNQVSDRIIILLCIFGLAVVALVIALFECGMLTDVPLMARLAEACGGYAGESPEQVAGSLSLLTYIAMVCVGQYLVTLVFLVYVEHSLIDPIKTMSAAARDFIISDSAISADDVEARCSEFSERGDEIGGLSRSLMRLTRDVADYVQDIESLRRDKQAYRAELAIARQIQMGLIPKNFDSVEGTGVTLSGLMDTAKTVGGDLYDFMVLPRWRVAVFIGDVSGKGIPAALFMSRAKALMEDHADRGSDPGTTFYEINNALSKENTQLLFVSSWHAVIDTRTGVVEFANAGHCPPLLYRAETKQASFVEMVPHPVLGVIPNATYGTETLTLRVGDRLMLYTDGLTEANADYQGFYGSERLRGVFEDTSGLSLEEQLKVIREDVKNFVGNAEQFDDMTMLLIRFDGRSEATGLRAPPGERVPST